MLAELVQKIIDIAPASQRATVISKNERKLLMAGSNGAVFEHDVAVPLRKHRPQTIDDVVAMCNDENLVDAPEIHYDANSITVFLDRNERLDTAVLTLNPSQRFLNVKSIEGKGVAFDIASLIRFMRFGLHGTGIDPLVAQLGKIDFKRVDDANNAVRHGSETLGRRVEASVQGSDRIPETFDVTVNAWNTRGCELYRMNVQCGIYLDVVAQKVTLCAMADQIDIGLNLCLDALGAELRRQLPNVPVFNSTP